MKNKSVVVYQETYTSAEGGPAKSFEMLFPLKFPEELNVEYVTQHSPYYPVKTRHERLKVLNYRSRLAHKIGLKMILHMVKSIYEGKTIHISTLWDIPMLSCILMCRIVGKELIIQPKGSADYVSFKRKRRFKLIFAQFFLRHNRIYWLTASHRESDIIQRIFKSKKIYEARYFLHEKLTKSSQNIFRNDAIDLIYLSRLNWKKGLYEFLKYSQNYSFYREVNLDVYGEAQDFDYMKKLIAASENSPINVNFKGWLDIGKGEVFSKYHFFLLPTFGENFGISILEALSTGTPVLTTIDSSWVVVEERGAGIAGKNAIDILEYLASYDLDEGEYFNMRKSAYSLADEFTPDNYIQVLTRLYESC